jgi:hypothetical protein
MLPYNLSYHITPIFAIIGYLVYPKDLRISPSLLYILSVIHNGTLVLFSAWTFASLSQILYNNGIIFKIYTLIQLFIFFTFQNIMNFSTPFYYI